MGKKTFKCGHKGKGQYCHRCAQDKVAQGEAAQQQQANAAWNRLFDDDPIDLRFLGKRSLIEKARHIIARIEAGAPYTEFRGKRMQYDRTVISVPLNYDFRMIYHQTEAGLQLVDLMGHEQYNVKKPGARV